MDRLLVLWDVDHTLVDVDGVGREAYDLAFLRLFDRPVVHQPPMAGRTDRAIALDMLRLNDVTSPERHLEAMRAAAEAALDELAEQPPARGRALPGAHEALLAVHGTAAVQSLLTGNVRRMAEVKLGPFGLMKYLDLDSGAYGWSDTVRGHLVHVARAAAAGRYRRRFPGSRTVLVGDTPLDVEAALSTGAGVVAVATGRFSVEELRTAGAHVTLENLADTQRVLEAITEAGR
ncbi:haloacid dehalogenase-like hydrolase [Dactylosporangium fulvum]|uniref:HAD family hydrolase n=1 Tax=Dactylosporangium fulvum TaxID=53359 RepID=UPI0031DFE73F